MKCVLFVLLCATMACAQFNGPCYNITGAPCASEDTSWLSRLELAIHTARQTAILADAVKNSIAQHGLPGNNLGGELANLESVLRAGQALNQATANLSVQWNKTFPTVPPAYGGKSQPTFPQDFAKWSTAASDSIRIAALAGSLSHVQQLGIVGILNQIEGILSVVDGRLRSSMLTAAATARTAASIEKLHDSILSQGSAAQVYMMYNVQKDIQRQAATQQFFGTGFVQSDGWRPSSSMVGP